MLKIRRSRDHLIFNMGIPIPGKDGLYIETGPGVWKHVLRVIYLSHWGRDKMANILADNIFKCIFLNENI